MDIKKKETLPDGSVKIIALKTQEFYYYVYETIHDKFFAYITFEDKKGEPKGLYSPDFESAEACHDWADQFVKKDLKDVMKFIAGGIKHEAD